MEVEGLEDVPEGVEIPDGGLVLVGVGLDQYLDGVVGVGWGRLPGLSRLYR